MPVKQILSLYIYIFIYVYIYIHTHQNQYIFVCMFFNASHSQSVSLFVTVNMFSPQPFCVHHCSYLPTITHRRPCVSWMLLALLQLSCAVSFPGKGQQDQAAEACHLSLMPFCGCLPSHSCPSPHQSEKPASKRGYANLSGSYPGWSR